MHFEQRTNMRRPQTNLDILFGTHSKRRFSISLNSFLLSFISHPKHWTQPFGRRQCDHFWRILASQFGYQHCFHQAFRFLVDRMYCPILNHFSFGLPYWSPRHKCECWPISHNDYCDQWTNCEQLSDTSHEIGCQIKFVSHSIISIPSTQNQNCGLDGS